MSPHAARPPQKHPGSAARSRSTPRASTRDRRIGVLGPLLVHDGRRDLVPTAPKPRQLLAHLLLNANQVVRFSDCITELWGNDPPRSALHTLHTYAGVIRRAVDEDTHGSVRLRTRQCCYQLLVLRPDYDLFAFDQLAQRGQQAADAGDDDAASALFAAALALWRGDVLSDVTIGPIAAASVVRLQESRKTVLEQRIEADLRLGRHAELLGELAALIGRHPTHENLHAQFMLALHRSGHTGNAVKVFDRLRSRLIDRLGIEPAPQTRRLYQAIVSRHPRLDDFTREARPRRATLSA